MTVGCCSAVTLVRRNHLAATHRSPTVRTAEWRRIDDLRSSACLKQRRGRPPGRVHSGWGRSGTTVVDRLLGQLPGFCSVGELRSLWDCDPVSHPARAASRSRSANCRRRLREALGGVTTSGFATMRELRDRSSRSRDVPVRWASSAVHRPTGPITLEYGNRLESLYRQVAWRSGAHTIVDSSKHPSEA